MITVARGRQNSRGNVDFALIYLQWLNKRDHSLWEANDCGYENTGIVSGCKGRFRHTFCAVAELDSSAIHTGVTRLETIPE